MDSSKFITPLSAKMLSQKIEPVKKNFEKHLTNSCKSIIIRGQSRNGGENMKTAKEQTVSEAMLDLKAINEKLETLPHDSLMYVAGAISALAATNTAPPSMRSSA